MIKSEKGIVTLSGDIVTLTADLTVAISSLQESVTVKGESFNVLDALIHVLKDDKVISIKVDETKPKPGSWNMDDILGKNKK